MTTYHVRPLPDGVALRVNWQVQKNRRRESTHTKKAAAKNAARRMARAGDTIVLHRVDGTVQERVTYQGSSASGGGDSAAGGKLFSPTPFGKIFD